MSDYFESRSAEWDQHKYRVERAQKVAASIKGKVPLSNTMKAMDFGCGTGLLGFNLIDYVGQMTFGDTSPGMIDQVSRKIHDGKYPNASTVLLDDKYVFSEFNLIVSLMVLHHIEDVESLVSNLSSSIVQGGYICLCDLDKEDGSFHQEETVPHNGFERKDIESILTRNGIETVDISTVYVNKKEIKGRMRDFPVFMIVGKKFA